MASLACGLPVCFAPSFSSVGQRIHSFRATRSALTPGFCPKVKPVTTTRPHIQIATPKRLSKRDVAAKLHFEQLKAVSEDDETYASKPSTEGALAQYANPTNWPERFRVVFLCFISFVICNCDRINISVAILPMAKYYGWSQTTVGIIQSSFFWGYVLTQIPGGYLADKYGGKHVLAAGVVVWSAMTLLTPAAASTNIGVLLLARALLGVGEGVAMPAMNNIMSKWVPKVERARSLSLVYSGMYLGSVVGLWLCPTFIVSFGWQSVFYIFGALGFVWWVFWQCIAASSPQTSKSIRSEERSYILGAVKQGSGGANPKNVPWRKLLSKAPTWAIIVAHFCTTWGKYARGYDEGFVTVSYEGHS